MPKNTRIVYSTDSGRISDKPAAEEPPASDGVVRIRRESKGRGGKAVSVISGLGLDSQALKKLAKELKQACGVGGAVKRWDIEIQGDQREKLKAVLEKRGYSVKYSGG